MTSLTLPSLLSPPGACDCHMHFFGDQWPLAANARKREPEASVAQYRQVQARLGLERVVVVQPTAYGRDNRCTLAAMAELGDCARGVAVIDDSISDTELAALDCAGIRGVRFRMLDKPELPWELLGTLAHRVAGYGWHIQFQMDGRLLHEREDLLRAMPCPLVIEHIGKFLEPVPESHPGFQSLLRLLDTGSVWVKLSGAYMLSHSGPPFYDDIGVLAKALVRQFPQRMVWASNWPHPLPSRTQPPDEATLLDVLLDWAPDAAIRQQILAGNPAALYGFPPV